MTQVTVKFTISPGEGIKAYWLAVSRKDVIDEDIPVPLQNASGSIDITKGRDHMVTWWMEGNPGATIGIVGVTDAGTANEKEVFKVEESTIPSTKGESAGAKPIRVN